MVFVGFTCFELYYVDYQKITPPCAIILYFLTFYIPTIGISKYIWYMYPAFVCGYYFNEYHIIDKVFNDRNLLVELTVVFGLVYLFLLLFFEKETYIYWSQYTVLNGGGWMQATRNIQRTITGLCGSLFIVGFVRFCCDYVGQRTRNVLSYLGRNTLELYIISTFPALIKIVSYASVDGVNYLLVFTVFIGVLLTSLGIVYLLKLSRITNFLFFGKPISRKS